MKLLGSLFLFIAIGYSALALLLYLMQERMIFFPVAANKNLYQHYSQQEYHIELNGHRIQGWRVDNPRATTHKVIIYYGGNAEDVVYNLDDAHRYNASHLFFTNYRGYGNSSGRATERNLYQDALALYDHLLENNQFNPEDIVIMGRSLGSSVAAYLASQRPAAGLILITPFDSVEDVAAHYYSWLPVRWLLKHKFDTQLHIQQLEIPMLLMNAQYDEVIPKHNFDTLLNSVNHKAQSVEIPNSNHQTISSHAEYFLQINDFINHLTTAEL